LGKMKGKEEGSGTKKKGILIPFWVLAGGEIQEKKGLGEGGKEGKPRDFRKKVRVLRGYGKGQEGPRWAPGR